MRPLATAALQWLEPHRRDVVTVVFAPSLNGNLTGTSNGGKAIVLALARAGVGVQVPQTHSYGVGGAGRAQCCGWRSAGRAGWIAGPPGGPRRRRQSAAAPGSAVRLPRAA